MENPLEKSSEATLELSSKKPVEPVKTVEDKPVTPQSVEIAIKTALAATKEAPLSESEARSFIAKEVFAVVSKWAVAFFAIFGIANALAVWGIYTSARDAAKTEASNIAKNEILESRALLESAKKEVWTMEVTTKDASDRVKVLTDDAKALQGKFDSLKDSKEGDIVAKATALSKLTSADVNNILSELQKISTQVEKRAKYGDRIRLTNAEDPKLSLTMRFDGTRAAIVDFNNTDAKQLWTLEK